jgi:hypothetical protein
VDVLGVEVEGGQRGDRGHQHPHGVRVVVEPLQEPLADVLVDERVVRDVVGPRFQLLLAGQLAVDQQVRHLDVGRLLGQLLDGVAPVAQDARVAVDLGDAAGAERRGAEGRVVEPDVREQLAPLGGVDAAVGDRDLHGITTAIVRDRDAVGHGRVAPCPGHVSIRRAVGRLQLGATYG